MDGLQCHESSSENSFCVIETRALRRSSVSRPGDGRTIRQRSRQAFTGDKTFATYQQVNHKDLQFRRVRFRLLSACSELRSGSRSRQPTTTRNDHKPGLRVFLNWMIAGSGSVITAVMSLRNQWLALSNSILFVCLTPRTLRRNGVCELRFLVQSYTGRVRLT